MKFIKTLLLVLTLLLTGCEKPPAFYSTDISGVEWGKDFTLTDHTGQVRTLADFRGKAVLIFFGYTQCPDICPTTLVAMNEVMSLLGNDAQKLQVLFVTVDPERDTQALLAQYVPQFNPAFLGLRGSEDVTAATARTFHIYYRKVPGTSAAPDSYTVDHSSDSYVFDPQGRLRLKVPYGMDHAKLAADLKLIISGQ